MGSLYELWWPGPGPVLPEKTGRLRGGDLVKEWQHRDQHQHQHREWGERTD